jgi:hypothetical protein
VVNVIRYWVDILGNNIKMILTIIHIFIAKNVSKNKDFYLKQNQFDNTNLLFAGDE